MSSKNSQGHGFSQGIGTPRRRTRSLPSPVERRRVPLRHTPTEIDMDRDNLWRWRIVIIGDGWTTERWCHGPRWLAKRHVRRLFHKLQES
jgi:hypothetical protein